ncbi:hypothetical protein RvY_18753 [Ramazzottius varieornatus]|uniref:Stathmin n=2 Tax=Ramazzottius varieornatus TaxID=947166 RepID=A0A1D1W6Z7_RAMVA|nr:hypothetical protein RvY_18753 [Ramazzottius varieornatus]
MSRTNGTGDAGLDGQTTMEDVEGVGSPVRVRRSGMAFAVTLDNASPVGPVSLETGILRRSNSDENGDNTGLTAEQIREKLAAAEARRESAINDLRSRCAEEAFKVEKAREQRQKEVEVIEAKIEAKMENAQANVEAQREALISRLRKEGDRHSDVLHRQSEEFMQRLQQLDAKFTDSEGKRNQMLMEMVEKVKEHNDRVHEISQKMNNEKDQRSAEEEKALNEQWEQAITQRQQYYDSAEKQLKEKSMMLHNEPETVVVQNTTTVVTTVHQ